MLVLIAFLLFLILCAVAPDLVAGLFVLALWCAGFALVIGVIGLIAIS